MPENVSQLTARDLLSDSFVRVDANDHVSTLMAALKKSGEQCALVFDGKTLVGVASNSGLLRNVDVTKTKIASIVRTLPSVSPSQSFESLARLMRDGDVRVLPVFEKGRLVGVVHAHALLVRLSNHPIFGSVVANDLASKNPLSVSPDDSLTHAIRLMKDSRVRKLPVLDKQRKPVGMLRVEDLATDILLPLNRAGKSDFKLGRGNQSISKGPGLELKVKSIMDENVSIISPGEKGKSVVKMLASQSNPVLMVIDNGAAGLISVQSVLDVFLNTKTQSISNPISITHLPDIDEIDRSNVEQMLQRTYDRVARTLKASDRMHVVFKQSRKSGLRARTTVHITLSGAGKTHHAEGVDWKVLLATKEACRALEAEVSNRFKRRSRNK